MTTKITRDIDFCAKLLREGAVVSIPTETVYGLAADMYNELAVKEIYRLKKRPRNNPLILHIHDVEQLKELTKTVPEKAKVLAEHFWPGPVSLVLPKSHRVNEQISAGLSTVAVRMPSHPVTVDLLKAFGKPLAAPSANLFTRISPTSAQHVMKYFDGAIPAILDGGPCQVGLESTILKIDGDRIILLRKGGISREAIENAVGPVEVLEHEVEILSPGMHPLHYAPKTELFVTDNILAEILNHPNRKIGLLIFNKFNLEVPVDKIIYLSEKNDLEEAAKNLYQALHDMDQSHLDVIIAQKLPERGLGASINDRLERAQRG